MHAKEWSDTKRWWVSNRDVSINDLHVSDGERLKACQHWFQLMAGAIMGAICNQDPTLLSESMQFRVKCSLV